MVKAAVSVETEKKEPNTRYQMRHVLMPLFVSASGIEPKQGVLEHTVFVYSGLLLSLVMCACVNLIPWKSTNGKCAGIV